MGRRRPYLNSGQSSGGSCQATSCCSENLFLERSEGTGDSFERISAFPTEAGPFLQLNHLKLEYSTLLRDSSSSSSTETEVGEESRERWHVLLRRLRWLPAPTMLGGGSRTGIGDVVSLAKMGGEYWEGGGTGSRRAGALRQLMSTSAEWQMKGWVSKKSWFKWKD